MFVEHFGVFLSDQWKSVTILPDLEPDSREVEASHERADLDATTVKDTSQTNMNMKPSPLNANYYYSDRECIMWTIPNEYWNVLYKFLSRLESKTLETNSNTTNTNTQIANCWSLKSPTIYKSINELFLRGGPTSGPTSGPATSSSSGVDRTSTATNTRIDNNRSNTNTNTRNILKFILIPL